MYMFWECLFGDVAFHISCSYLGIDVLNIRVGVTSMFLFLFLFLSSLWVHLAYRELMFIYEK